MKAQQPLVQCSRCGVVGGKREIAGVPDEGMRLCRKCAAELCPDLGCHVENATDGTMNIVCD